MDQEQITSLTPATLTPVTGNTLGSQRSETPPPAWGKLASTISYMKSVDLDKPNFLLGRGTGCDVILSKCNFPVKSLSTISKTHFTITYNDTKNIAELTDTSKNGTFVNQKNIGKGKTIILENYDEIAIGSKDLRVYVYRTILTDKDSFLPLELSYKYVPSRSLGSGSYGEVRLIFEKLTGLEYAVKKISKQGQLDERIQNEIEILKCLSHPHIMSTKEIAETDEAVFIILEYMKGGDLTDRMNSSIYPLPENETKLIFYQIAQGVQYLHSQNITHRDLKPGNILLKTEDSSTLVKISDFGLSKIIHTTTGMYTVCGTPHYVAPEIIDQRCSDYTQAVDVWSLGVILFQMLSRVLPFMAKDDRTLYSLILSCKYTMDDNDWKIVSNDARDLVKRMLVTNPTDRITIDAVLNHRWFAKDEDVQEKARQLIHEDENANTSNNVAKKPRLH